MKNIKSFTQFTNEGFKEFFTGHDSSEDRENKKQKFLEELDIIENDLDANIVFSREKLENAAELNNYKGNLDTKELPNGKTMYIYKNGVISLGRNGGGQAPVAELA